MRSGVFLCFYEDKERPDDVVIFTTSPKLLRTMSSFSPRHPSSSGRRRHFHHVIQTPPDDVAIFTTSSKPLRTTSPFSPRHPNPSGRRRHFHHVIQTQKKPKLLSSFGFHHHLVNWLTACHTVHLPRCIARFLTG